MIHLKKSLPDGQGSLSKVTFQCVSDLHLELNSQYSTYAIKPSAPYLIFAGDVGTLADYQLYVEFLRRHCLLFKQIYLVLGNHEFHHLSHAQTLSRAQDLETEEVLKGKVTVLHRRRVDVEGVIMLGCTLWSHIPDSARQVVQGRVKDYQHIHGWSVNMHNSEHVKDVEWLKKELENVGREDTRNVLIVTHHAPSNVGTSNPVHASNPWSSAFSTPLLEGEAKKWLGIEHVSYWVFGHTHWTTQIMCGGLTVVSNQRGYVREQRTTERSASSAMIKKHVFDQSRTLEIYHSYLVTAS